MPYSKINISNKPKIFKNKKNKTEQLQNVISMRINNNEKKTLEKLSMSTSKTISEIMRDAIDLWRSKQHKLCLD